MRGRNPIVAQRLRVIPLRFSWVDHRLVRDGHIRGLSAHALALYLFLVTVADAEGLSWYAETTLCRQLSWSGGELKRARAELDRAGLIAYCRPLYQVLDLAPRAIETDRPRIPGPPSAGAVSVGDILRGLLAPDHESREGQGGGR